MILHSCTLAGRVQCLWLTYTDGATGPNPAPTRLRLGRYARARCFVQYMCAFAEDGTLVPRTADRGGFVRILKQHGSCSETVYKITKAQILCPGS